MTGILCLVSQRPVPAIAAAAVVLKSQYREAEGDEGQVETLGDQIAQYGGGLLLPVSVEFNI